MIPGKRTFYGVSRKRLLLGVLALLFYGGAVLAFGSMMEEPSVSVFLSGTYPEKEQAEEIVKTLEQTEAETSACFYWDGGMTTLTEPDYGRSAQVMAAGILGDGSLYDKRIRGFWETEIQPGSFLAPERQRDASLYTGKKLIRSVRCFPGSRG